MFDDIPLTLAQEVQAPPVSSAQDRPQNVPREVAPAEKGTAETRPPSPANGPPPGGMGSGLTQFLPFILIIVIFWVIMMGGQRREKKKRATMLAALSKGDKVQTVGGVLGTVVEVRDSEVVLKVDENANVRIKFARAAIQSVIQDKDAP